MMTVIVTVFKTAGRTVTERKKETMLLRTQHQTTLAPPLLIEEPGQGYKHAAQFSYPGGLIPENADPTIEID
ncbi:MAG: hypothetical protein ABJL67_05100, partial [Sulfitobacter sp.]